MAHRQGRSSCPRALSHPSLSARYHTCTSATTLAYRGRPKSASIRLQAQCHVHLSQKWTYRTTAADSSPTASTTAARNPAWTRKHVGTTIAGAPGAIFHCNPSFRPFSTLYRPPSQEQPSMKQSSGALRQTRRETTLPPRGPTPLLTLPRQTGVTPRTTQPLRQRLGAAPHPQHLPGLHLQLRQAVPVPPRGARSAIRPVTRHRHPPRTLPLLWQRGPSDPQGHLHRSRSTRGSLPGRQKVITSSRALGGYGRDAGFDE